MSQEPPTSFNAEEEVCYHDIAILISSVKGLYYQHTKGKGTPEIAMRVWNAMGDHTGQLLITKKSCIFPDFFHVSIKVQKIQFFDGSTRQFYKPQFMLLDDFTSKYMVKNVLTAHDVHYHETVPTQISINEIGTLAGVDRHTTEAVLKDSVREIGKYILEDRTAVLVVDIGCCVLEMKHKEYRIKWSEPFLEALRRTVGADALVSPYDPPSMTTKGKSTTK